MESGLKAAATAALTHTNLKMSLSPGRLNSDPEIGIQQSVKSERTSTAANCDRMESTQTPTSNGLDNLRGDTRLFGEVRRMRSGTQNLFQKRKLFSKLAEKGVKSVQSKTHLEEQCSSGQFLKS